MLKIEKVDWHLLENAKEHHTDRYEVIHEESTPVLRRSQPFRLSLFFNRPFNETTDRIRLLFKHVNKSPQPRIEDIIENTDVTSTNRINGSLTMWSLQIESQHKNMISILVRSPPTAAWGLWALSAKIRHGDDTEAVIWISPIQFWLLFNPWIKDDDVYMPDTKFLDEFILNDVGKVYTTSSKRPVGMKWIYGQFGAPVLKVLKMVLDEKELDEVQLGSPVELTRAMIRVDEIIEGKWSGPYDDGTAPWLWTGSLAIFDEYLKRGKPAKYAQCFVYGGIFTTALRAVGIPSRNVTNFLSATSGGETMSVNYIYDANGKARESPSIWNFHVWNDAWMSRKDLPAGYGGWQAVDKDYGPAPLEAIKRGEICFSYDVNHVMAQCNSDRVRWNRATDGSFQLIKIDTDYMGKAMLTKQPFIYDPHGDTDFLDVISFYKESEGSKEERQAVYNAVKYCKISNKKMEKELARMTAEEKEFIRKHYGTFPYHIDLVLDDTVKLHLKEIDSIPFGQNFFVILKIENLGEKTITIQATLGVTSIYYNGAIAGLIKKEQNSIIIKQKTEGSIMMLIKPEEYAAKLVEFTILNVHCIATIKENNYTWANDFQFNIEMPQMKIKPKGDLILNREGIILFQFKNSLKTKLTNCSITYEAPGIGRNNQISVRDINEGEDAIIEHKVTPLSAGEILINAIFTSNQLTFLGGSATLQVD